MTRRLSEALRSASDALAVAADASREGSSTSSGHGEDSHDDCCCEKHRRPRHHCGAVCATYCGVHLEHRSCSHDEAPEGHSYEQRSQSEADERETCCRAAFRGPARPLRPILRSRPMPRIRPIRRFPRPPCMRRCSGFRLRLPPTADFDSDVRFMAGPARGPPAGPPAENSDRLARPSSQGQAQDRLRIP